MVEIYNMQAESCTCIFSLLGYLSLNNRMTTCWNSMCESTKLIDIIGFFYRIMFQKTLEAFLVLNLPSPLTQVITTCSLDLKISQRSRHWFPHTYK